MRKVIRVMRRFGAVSSILTFQGWSSWAQAPFHVLYNNAVQKSSAEDVSGKSKCLTFFNDISHNGQYSGQPFDFDSYIDWIGAILCCELYRAVSSCYCSSAATTFRHALIVNLLVADFINSLNNTVSGILAIKDGYADLKASPSTGCVANAWVGQFSVQAIDFNILIISVSVLLAVQRQHILDDSSRLMTAIVCLVPWIPGTITSFVGLGLHVYGPVSGNWCWIQTQHLGLRYGLTHAWRIAIFLATVAIYTYIYIKLRRLFSFVKYGLSSSTTKGYTTNAQSRIDRENAEQSDTQRIWVTTTVEASYELESRGIAKVDQSEGEDISPGGKVQWSASAMPEPEPPTAEDHGTNNTQNVSTSNGPNHRVPKSPNLRRMLLLNGYLIAYIILWLPGIANRLAESVGTSPKWLTALQASTQFIGLVNALTYGLTEQMQRAVQMWMKRRSFRTLDP